jgi:hypothetical protein
LVRIPDGARKSHRRVSQKLPGSPGRIFTVSYNVITTYGKLSGSEPRDRKTLPPAYPVAALPDFGVGFQ